MEIVLLWILEDTIFDRYKSMILTYWHSIFCQFFQKAIVSIISEWKWEFNADFNTRNDSLVLENCVVNMYIRYYYSWQLQIANK